MFDKLKSGLNNVIKKLKIKDLSEKELGPVIDSLKELMIKNEVSYRTADSICIELKKELIKKEHERFKNITPIVTDALRNSVRKVLEITNVDVNDVLFNQIEKAKQEKRPYIICMLGINGTGKTTTIAKITKKLLDRKYTVVWSASDTYRSGSIQQLGKHAEKLGVRMIAHDYGGDPAAVAIDAIDHAETKGIDVVIIDTAGRMQNNVNLVRELGKIMRLTEPDLKIFVGDSLAGNDVIRQAEQFNSEIGFDGIIMTKLDSDAKGGAVISVAHITNKPILFLGVGQSYDDLKEFQPELIIKEVIPL
ncbi:MAG: signal recognition particle-docking protein FtsY [Candidatus Heimdallarchaeota archaeon]|nr:signal recognition particle-docking protein FtsY [Candidatus Heimdallarchaeota archaeon]